MANEIKVTPVCYLRVSGRTNSGTIWAQEHYDGMTNHARVRAAQLRKLGYKATCASLGPQVTSVGLIKMTMVNVYSTYDNLIPEPEIMSHL
jgi:hypothetical protein